jgi:metal-dependent amidase/aminoacylase/carboxypeptidase family protein
VAAQLVTALQTIASRNHDPVKNLVVSVTSFRTESEAFNVIPEHVELKGTVRTMDAETRTMAEARIKALAEGWPASFGASGRGGPI